jgi:hypothetical protein
VGVFVFFKAVAQDATEKELSQEGKGFWEMQMRPRPI